MFLVAAALVSAWLITVAELPAQVVALLEPFMGNQTILLLAMMALVVIVGTALDMTPTILILTPVLMPIVKQAGIDPIYFGVLFIINNSIGLITPPVGTVLNVVCGVAKVKMDDIIKGVWPFMIAQLARSPAAGSVSGAGHRPGAVVQRLAIRIRGPAIGRCAWSPLCSSVQRGERNMKKSTGWLLAAVLAEWASPPARPRRR